MDMATYSTIGADEADKALLHNKPKTSFKAIVAGAAVDVHGLQNWLVSHGEGRALPRQD